MMCNGCGEGEKGPRYISITARPGRYRGGVNYIIILGLYWLLLKMFLTIKGQSFRQGQRNSRKG